MAFKQFAMLLLFSGWENIQIICSFSSLQFVLMSPFVVNYQKKYFWIPLYSKSPSQLVLFVHDLHDTMSFLIIWLGSLDTFVHFCLHLTTTVVSGCSSIIQIHSIGMIWVGFTRPYTDTLSLTKKKKMSWIAMHISWKMSSINILWAVHQSCSCFTESVCRI